MAYVIYLYYTRFMTYVNNYFENFPDIIFFIRVRLLFFDF